MATKVTQNAPQQLYNIKAVSNRVGVLPVTIRAWERRYGFPVPQRGDQGYRLYSENDVNTLIWLKTKVNSGMSISQAAKNLRSMRTIGKVNSFSLNTTELESVSIPPEHYRQLMEMLLKFNRKKSKQLFWGDISKYHLDQVLINIVKPVLIEIGEAWSNGDVPVATEHFISNFFLENMYQIMAGLDEPIHPGVVIAAGAPGELHYIGILMLSLMLQERGIDVRFFGPNLKLDRIDEIVRILKPRMLLFSSTSETSAKALEPLGSILAKINGEKPMIILGGQGFHAFHPSTALATYLDDNPLSIVNNIERLIQKKP